MRYEIGHTVPVDVLKPNGARSSAAVVATEKSDVFSSQLLWPFMIPYHLCPHPDIIQIGRRCLTHWGRVTHICVSKLPIIGLDNGLSPGRRQAIIWTNDGLLLIGPLETNFSEILIEIHTLSFKEMHLKMSSGKWRPFCLGLNVLKNWSFQI